MHSERSTHDGGVLGVGYGAEAVEEEATIIERAARSIRVYGYEQMNTVADRQNSKWCLMVWSLCELLGI